LQYYNVMIPNFSIHFCNIRGLATNFCAVEAHLFSEKPALLALCETQVKDDNINFNINGYSLVSHFIPHRGYVALYIRSDVTFNTLHSFKGSNHIFHYLWIKLRVEKSTIFFCFLYRSPTILLTLRLVTPTIAFLNPLSQ